MTEAVIMGLYAGFWLMISLTAALCTTSAYFLLKYAWKRGWIKKAVYTITRFAVSVIRRLWRRLFKRLRAIRWPLTSVLAVTAIGFLVAFGAQELTTGSAAARSNAQELIYLLSCAGGLTGFLTLALCVQMVFRPLLKK